MGGRAGMLLGRGRRALVRQRRRLSRHVRAAHEATSFPAARASRSTFCSSRTGTGCLGNTREGRGFPWVAFPRRNMAADVHHHERVLRECSASEVSEALARAVDWTRSMDSVQGWRARLLLCRTALKREDKLFLNLDQLVELFGRGSGELFEALVTCLKSCRLVQ